MDDELKVQFVDTFAKLITAAFAMVAALAWNGAIKALIDSFVGPEGDPLIGLFVYAIIVTVIAVLAVVWITRSSTRLQAMVKKKKNEEQNKEQ